MQQSEIAGRDDASVIDTCYSIFSNKRKRLSNREWNAQYSVVETDDLKKRRKAEVENPPKRKCESSDELVKRGSGRGP